MKPHLYVVPKPEEKREYRYSIPSSPPPKKTFMEAWLEEIRKDRARPKEGNPWKLATAIGAGVICLMFLSQFMLSPASVIPAGIFFLISRKCLMDYLGES
jgi:hypothetical protein